MAFKHLSKFMVGFKTTPLELFHPVTKEFGGPGFRRIGPEVVEGFFQQIGFKELAVGAEQGIQSLSSVATDMISTRQQDKLLACQTPPKAPRRLAQFLFTNLIESFQKMLDDVKLVIDNLRLRALGKKTVSKGFPHVHDPMGDTLSTIFSKPLPELCQMFFSSAFPNEQKFGSPGSPQGTDQMPVGLALPDGNLIDSQNGNSIQGSRGLLPFQSKFIDSLHRPPMQGLKDRHRLDRHDFAQLCDQRCQGLGDPSPSGNKGQRLQIQPTRRAIDPVVSHPKKSQILPQHQMLNLDHPTRMGLFDAAMALLTFKAATHPFEIQDHCFSTLSEFHAYTKNPKPLYPQQFCETIRSHLVGSPFRLFRVKRRENILPDAFISTTNLHNNSS